MNKESILKNDLVLQSFAKEIKLFLCDNLKQLLLYGSRSRGDESDDSDYDCFLLVKDISRQLKKELHNISGKYLFKYNAIFSLLVVNEIEYNANSKNHPLYMSIKKEGLVIE